jgi:hypothetical protein
MIYTIGDAETYEPLFGEGRVPSRLGRGLDHAGRAHGGGAVWRTLADARAYLRDQGLDPSHRAYGLLADWATQTADFRGEPHRRLLATSPLVRLAEGAP